MKYLENGVLRRTFEREGLWLWVIKLDLVGISSWSKHKLMVMILCLLRFRRLACIAGFGLD